MKDDTKCSDTRNRGLERIITAGIAVLGDGYLFEEVLKSSLDVSWDLAKQNTSTLPPHETKSYAVLGTGPFKSTALNIALEAYYVICRRDRYM